MFQAVRTVGLGERGCALPKTRSSGLLPEEAKIFLQDLFDRGEENSSEKVRLGMLYSILKQLFTAKLC